MTEPDVIEKFNQYKQRCEGESGVSVDNQFQVSEAARKKCIIPPCTIIDGRFAASPQLSLMLESSAILGRLVIQPDKKNLNRYFR